MKHANYHLLSKKYPDQWVAVESRSGRVVGASRSAQVAYDQSQKKGTKVPLMMKIPKEYGTYILIASSV
ncbi:MAG: DUF5678 domain-containing protein [Patescibacteria group bacterium]